MSNFPVFAEEVPPPRTSGKAVASLILGIASFMFLCVTGIPAFILGLISLNQINNSQGRLQGKGLAIAGMVTSGISTVMIAPIAILMALLLPAIAQVRERARQTPSMSNMREIDMAVIAHVQSKDAFPAAAGSPGGADVSWRVRLLPHMDALAVFNQYDLTKSWDSSENQAVSNQRVTPYCNPNSPGSNQTQYLALVGRGTLFEPGKRVRFQDVTDGLSNTVLFVEADADRAVPWAKPQDINYNPANPMAGLGHFRPGVFLVAFADGSVKSIPTNINRKSFTRW